MNYTRASFYQPWHGCVLSAIRGGVTAPTLGIKCTLETVSTRYTALRCIRCAERLKTGYTAERYNQKWWYERLLLGYDRTSPEDLSENGLGPVDLLLSE